MTFHYPDSLFVGNDIVRNPVCVVTKEETVELKIPKVHPDELQIGVYSPMKRRFRYDR
jgi:hypothetical protein